MFLDVTRFKTPSYMVVLIPSIEGRRKIGRPIMNCMDEVYEWNTMSTRSLLDEMKDRYIWKKLCLTPYHVPPTVIRHGTSMNII